MLLASLNEGAVPNSSRRAVCCVYKGGFVKVVTLEEAGAGVARRPDGLVCEN